VHKNNKAKEQQRKIFEKQYIVACSGHKLAHLEFKGFANQVETKV
jgi:hypothetical protein